MKEEHLVKMASLRQEAELLKQQAEVEKMRKELKELRGEKMLPEENLKVHGLAKQIERKNIQKKTKTRNRQSKQRKVLGTV